MKAIFSDDSRLPDVELPADFEPMEIDTEGNRYREAALNDFGKYKIVNHLLREAMEGVDRLDFGNHERSLQYSTAIEVGSWAGANAIAMVKGTPGLFRLYCVDTWKGGHDTNGITAGVLGPRAVFQTFCRNVEPWLYREIFPVVGHSLTHAAVWPVMVPFIFIDAGHLYEECKADLEAWWPHVAKGGIIAGHDYQSFPEVKRAADEFGFDGQTDEIFWRVKT